MSAQRAPSLPPDWAAAIREDAGGWSSTSNIALMHAGLAERISSVRRVLVRVGTWYPDNPRSYILGGQHIVEYLKTPPLCQACNRRIQNGERAISYRCRRRPGFGRGHRRFIHEDCPEERSPK